MKLTTGEPAGWSAVAVGIVAVCVFVCIVIASRALDSGDETNGKIPLGGTPSGLLEYWGPANPRHRQSRRRSSASRRLRAETKAAVLTSRQRRAAAGRPDARTVWARGAGGQERVAR